MAASIPCSIVANKAATPMTTANVGMKRRRSELFEFYGGGNLALSLPEPTSASQRPDLLNHGE
jgi:hypothetical protein